MMQTVPPPRTQPKDIPQAPRDEGKHREKGQQAQRLDFKPPSPRCAPHTTSTEATENVLKLTRRTREKGTRSSHATA